MRINNDVEKINYIEECFFYKNTKVFLLTFFNKVFKINLATVSL